MKRWLLIVGGMLGLSLGGCAGVTADRNSGVDTTAEDTREQRAGHFLGRGITIGGDRNYEEAERVKIGVNSFLWQASLDAIDFMPIASADSNGGVILTEWFSPNDTPSERIKVDIHILGKKLTPTNLRVRVFRQTKTNGQWGFAPTNAATNRNLEDTILTKARKLRISALQD